MSDIELRVLITLEEYKNLQQIAKAHQECSVSNSEKTKTKDIALSEGSGVTSNSFGEERQSFQETYSNSCQSEKNIDQNIQLTPKEIIINDENPQTTKSLPTEQPLSIDTIVSQLKPRYRIKGRKILTSLLEHPEDFSYDSNGCVTIFKDSIPG